MRAETQRGKGRGGQRGSRLLLTAASMAPRRRLVLDGMRFSLCLRT
jgi:hypothetical protein